jgi:small conductance mechanosensitive channel
MNDFIAADTASQDPAPFMGLSADSSVNFAVRVWVDGPDYWNVYFEMNEKYIQICRL